MALARFIVFVVIGNLIHELGFGTLAIKQFFGILIPQELHVVAHQNSVRFRTIFQGQVGIGCKVKVADLIFAFIGAPHIDPLAIDLNLRAPPIDFGVLYLIGTVVLSVRATIPGVHFAIVGLASFISFLLLVLQQLLQVGLVHGFVVDLADDLFDNGLDIFRCGSSGESILAVKQQALIGLQFCNLSLDHLPKLFLGFFLAGSIGRKGGGPLNHLDRNGFHCGIVCAAVLYAVLRVGNSAILIEGDIRVALSFQLLLDIVLGETCFRRDADNGSGTILVQYGVGAVSIVGQAGIFFFTDFDGVFAVIPSGLRIAFVDDGDRILADVLFLLDRFGLVLYGPAHLGEIGIVDGATIRSSRSSACLIGKGITLAVCTNVALEHAFIGTLGVIIEISCTRRSLLEVETFAESGLDAVIDMGQTRLGPDHSGTGHLSGCFFGVLLGRRGAVFFGRYETADGIIVYIIVKGIGLIGAGIRPLELAVLRIGQVDIIGIKGIAGFLADGCGQCLLQRFVLCLLSGVCLGLVFGLAAVHLGVGLLAVVVGDGDIKAEAPAQQLIVLVFHKALFAAAGNVVQLAVLHGVFNTTGVLIQQIFQLFIVQGVVLLGTFLPDDGISQVVVGVIIGECAIFVGAGLLHNVLQVEGVILAGIVLDSDVFRRILIILLELLFFVRVLLAGHLDGQGSLGGFGGRAGIHRDGGGVRLALGVNVFLGQGIGAVTVILVIGLDQLGDVLAGHGAGERFFILLGQGEGFVAIFFDSAGHGVAADLSIRFGFPVQLFTLAAQLIIQRILHVLGESLVSLGTCITRAGDGRIKGGIGRGGGAVRVRGRFARHKFGLAAHGLRLVGGADLLFIVLVLGILIIRGRSAVIGAALHVVGAGITGLALFLRGVPVHSTGAVSGGGTVLVVGDGIFAVIIIHRNVIAANGVNGILVFLVPDFFLLFLFALDLAFCGLTFHRGGLGLRGSVILDRVGAFHSMGSHGLCSNTGGQGYGHGSEFQLFVRHD